MKPLEDAWAQLRAKPQVLGLAAALLVLTAGVFAWGMTQGSAAAGDGAIAQAPTTTSSAEGARTTAETGAVPDASVGPGERADPFAGGPGGTGAAGGGSGASSEESPDASTSATPSLSGASSSGGSGSSGSSGGGRTAVEQAGAAASGSSSGSSGSGSSGSSGSGSSGSSSGSGSSGSSGSSSGSGSGSSGSSGSGSSRGSGTKRTTTRSRVTAPLRFSAQLVWPGARRQRRGIALGSPLPSTDRPLYRIDSVNLEKRTVRIALQRRARLAPGNSKTLRCVQRDRGRCAIVQVPLGRGLTVAWGVKPEDPYKEYRITVMTAYRGSTVVARARTTTAIAASELTDPVTATTEAAAPTAP